MILYLKQTWPTEHIAKIRANKCKRPKFSYHGGRTWDFGYIKIDGVVKEAHLDTSWGRNIYFQYGPELHWFAIPMYSDMKYNNTENEYDIDPFRPKTAELSTVKL